jgi:hypothetical protein
MTAITIISAVFTGAITLLFAVYGYFTARCKGPILSNPYIWLDKKNREKEIERVGIKNIYRQLTITNVLCFLIMLTLTIDIIIKSRYLFILVLVFVVILIVYAIKSTAAHLKL